MAAYYEDQWPAYVSVAERRLKAEREAAKLRKKGSVLSPVTVEGRKIVSTFWGKAWCDNLESYRDYDNRLERGRSYVRNGLVIDLQIAPHVVTAMVSGSSTYTVRINIAEVPKANWKSICADCAGGIDSLVELLQGRFSKGVMERICRQGSGLFPRPAEIKFSCSCLDHASMCKHVAATLYGVGARLDAKPELLFRLRAVDENDLVADIGDALPMSKQGPAAGRVLEADDMAALFGLDMGGVAEPVGIDAPPTPAIKAPAAKGLAAKDPTTQGPATKGPATKGSAAKAPATKGLAAKAPATKAPATKAPATKGPTTQGPATKGSAAKAPATKGLAAKAPAAKGPTTKAPMILEKSAPTPKRAASKTAPWKGVSAGKASPRKESVMTGKPAAARQVGNTRAGTREARKSSQPQTATKPSMARKLQPAH
jgi:uncharacterized Zn finger protein